MLSQSYVVNPRYTTSVPNIHPSSTVIGNIIINLANAFTASSLHTKDISTTPIEGTNIATAKIA